MEAIKGDSNKQTCLHDLESVSYKPHDGIQWQWEILRQGEQIQDHMEERFWVTSVTFL